jgi:membrane associated rhomboid family serine protease
MGLYDRDYAQENFQSQYRYVPQMRLGLPKVTPVVKWLLIINITVFLLVMFIRPLGVFLYQWFPVEPDTLSRAVQVWRLVTYQFLHDSADIWHIFVNMLGLFFLGPTLERHWGGKKFLIFYLICGIAGGLFYTLLVGIGFLQANPMVGASGAILGLLAACAILFPHFVVIIFIFPVPIRMAAIGFAALYFLLVITGASNAGGNAAHLAGMATGAAYVLSRPWRDKITLKVRAGAWDRKMTAEQNIQAELDRILKKVHNSGIHSLSSKEKRTLKKATELERRRTGL